IRRAVREILVLMLSSLAVVLLKSMMESDDDDEKKALQYSLYAAMRLNMEVGFFLSPGTINSKFVPLLPDPYDFYRMAKSPTILFGTTDKVLRLVRQLLNPTEEYKVETGIWDKGDLKLKARFLQV